MNLADMGISAITFDLDDTLWPCDAVIQHAEQVYYDWITEHVPVIGKTHSKDSLRDLRRVLLESQPELVNDVTEWRLRATRELLINHNADPSLAEQAFDVFLQARQTVEFYPDVLNGLQDLSFHYRLGALTNGNADLETIGIAHLFDSTLYATLALPAKPAPQMFAQAAIELGVAPERILHVGDNARTDIGGARSAGYRTAWINRAALDYPTNVARADIDILSLDDLVSLAPVIPR